MLLNIWYVFSVVIGLIICLLGIIGCLIGGLMLFVGVPIIIKDKETTDIPFTFGIIISCLLISCIAFSVNFYIPKNQEIISCELRNIVSYEGIANIKEGKYNYDYLYFTQGENILKLSPNQCSLHYTNQNDIKIIERHTEYLSNFRYFAICSLDENINYDVYLPERYKK